MKRTLLVAALGLLLVPGCAPSMTASGQTLKEGQTWQYRLEGLLAVGSPSSTFKVAAVLTTSAYAGEFDVSGRSVLGDALLTSVGGR